jgi:two-component system response regulator DevR
MLALMPDPERPLRLLIVDDHEVVRQGLIAFLDRHERFEVVAEAGTCAEAISQARKFVPDLVLMDVRLPDASGIEACRMVRDEFPGTQVVFLSSSPDEADVLAAIVAGARGYVLKQSRSAELVRTLEAVGRGESLLDPSVTGMLIERVRRIASGTDEDHANDLTVREREILPLIAEGMTNKEIAAAVFLSAKTVKNYVSSILAKLDLDRRAQVPAFVAEHETSRPDE